MCAINPKHKKRIIFNFYTSDPNMTKEEFDHLVIKHCLETEIDMNSGNYQGNFRVHVKETDQEAE